MCWSSCLTTPVSTEPGWSKTAIRRLRRRGIELYYLSPYAPELNAIEVLFGAIKKHDLPERTYLHLDRLTTAVDGAFARRAPPQDTLCTQTVASCLMKDLSQRRTTHADNKPTVSSMKGKLSSLKKSI